MSQSMRPGLAIASRHIFCAPGKLSVVKLMIAILSRKRLWETNNWTARQDNGLAGGAETQILTFFSSFLFCSLEFKPCSFNVQPGCLIISSKLVAPQLQLWKGAERRDDRPLGSGRGRSTGNHAMTWTRTRGQGQGKKRMSWLVRRD